jgi:zinc/manganese transport system substrate-binding protein
MWKLAGAVAIAALAWGSAATATEHIPVLVAENFYGEVIGAIGGDRVAVTDVLMGPNVDPHDYEPAPSVARSVADAKLVVFNGANYDHWMEHLLEATERPGRETIDVANLIGVKEGDNPHVWYDPKTLPALANAAAGVLARLDPEGAGGYETRRDAYLASLAPLSAKVDALRQRYAGTPVTATEPVFGYMAAALGLEMGNGDFQTAIMNETEPSPRAIAAVLDDITSHKVRALIYNTQVTDGMTDQLLAAAKGANVPVVGVTETLPPGMAYADWMLSQLDSLEKALAGPST